MKRYEVEVRGRENRGGRGREEGEKRGGGGGGRKELGNLVPRLKQFKAIQYRKEKGRIQRLSRGEVYHRKEKGHRRIQGVSR